ncbi:MAG: hypothetical protein J6W88_05215 [Bacteroidales bacterium]|nr:hypothetical protein [Bacteroidales bacterium]
MEERNLKLQSEVKRYVNSIRKWYKFFAIVSIVGMSLMVVFGTLMFVFGNAITEAMAEQNASFNMPAWTIGVIYIVSAVVYVPIVIYLFKASHAARNAIAMNNNESARTFFRQSRNLWKYSGILTIVILGICAIAVSGAVVAIIATII